MQTFEIFEESYKKTPTAFRGLSRHAQAVIVHICNDTLHHGEDLSFSDRGRMLLKFYKKHFHSMPEPAITVEPLAWARCLLKEIKSMPSREAFTFRYFVDIPSGDYEQRYEETLRQLKEQVRRTAQEIRARYSHHHQSLLVPSSRFAILKRDGYRCRLCGASSRNGADVQLEVDHITPRARGGTNDPSNLWTLCFACNRGKGVNDL